MKKVILSAAVAASIFLASPVLAVTSTSKWNVQINNGYGNPVSFLYQNTSPGYFTMVTPTINGLSATAYIVSVQGEQLNSTVNYGVDSNNFCSIDIVAKFYVDANPSAKATVTGHGNVSCSVDENIIINDPNPVVTIMAIKQQ